VSVGAPNRESVRWKVFGGILLLCAAGAALWAVRPWADSFMTARVTLSTDEAGIVSEQTARLLFSETSDSRPVANMDLDLSQWEGQLVRLDIGGKVARRKLPEGRTGEIACAAELSDASGNRPIEFVGWQRGSKIGLHLGPVGTQAFELPGSDERRFAFTLGESLWRVIRVPPEGSIRLWLRPACSNDLPGRPEPVSPSAPTDGELVALPWPTKDEERPDIFVYVVDALRADHLGCYGYERGTSPNIDVFAPDATLFEQAMTLATWTKPAVASMLTGLYPTVHRAMHESDVLEEWPRLLSEMLRDAGYATLCVTANPQIAQHAGFGQGYDEFVLADPPVAAVVTGHAQRFLAKHDPEQPVFLYLHTMEPHEPYAPRLEDLRLFDRGFGGKYAGPVAWMHDVNPVRPGLSEEDYQHLIDLYDAEVLAADRGFAEFLSILRRAGRFDNALVIFTADHGESFGEHATWGHGYTLNKQELHVPLVVRFPDGAFAGATVGDRVSLLDLTPTVLATAGVQPNLPYRISGVNLGQTIRGGHGTSNRRIYGEVAFWDSNDLDLVGIIDEDGYKRVVDVSVLPRETAAKESLGLWNTRADPNEQVNLSEQLPVRAAYGEQLMAEWLLAQRDWRERLTTGRPPQVRLTPELHEKLKALGYLGGPQ